MNADRRCPEPIPKESHAALRAALYMRVSTGRQAEHDLSIPDQRSQLKCGAARMAITWLQSTLKLARLPAMIDGRASSR